MAAKKKTHPEKEKLDIPNVEVAKAFTIIRVGDESGVSGTGRVLDGFVAHNGKVVVFWRTDLPDSESTHGHSSIGIYDSFKAFKLIHIDSHPDNGTKIVWYDLKLSKENDLEL